MSSTSSSSPRSSSKTTSHMRLAARMERFQPARGMSGVQRLKRTMSASVTMSMIMDCMLFRYISKVVPSITSMA